MGKVTLKNTLHSKIVVQEGNAGVYLNLTTLQPGRSYELSLDPNATYRDYVLIRLPNGTKLPGFSSDDIQGLAAIIIMEEKKEEKVKYIWKGIPKGCPIPEEPSTALVTPPADTQQAPHVTPPADRIPESSQNHHNPESSAGIIERLGKFLKSFKSAGNAKKNPSAATRGAANPAPIGGAKVGL